MKWRCPICQKENQNKWKCNCGFDESRNYEKYRVMQLLSKEDIRNYINQKGNKDSFYEIREAMQARIGDTIKFGYGIEWIVLDRKGNKVLIITKDIIDSKVYNEKCTSITWENCTLRAWLNGEFLQQSFSMEERDRIEVTLVKNSYKKLWNRKNGGRDTQDKIFCLSIEEAKKYFKNNIARAVGSWWWLRSPGKEGCEAAVVTSDGSISHQGTGVHNKDSVRPALWLNLGF